MDEIMANFEILPAARSVYPDDAVLGAYKEGLSRLCSEENGHPY